MSKDTLIAVGAGVASALAALSFMAGSPGALVLIYVAPLPLFLVGLSRGARTGTVAAVAGLVLAVVMGGAVAAGLYGLVHALPAVMVMHQALMQRALPNGGVEWYPIGTLVSWLTVLAALFMIVAAIIGWGSTGGLAKAVTRHLNDGLTAMLPSLEETDRGKLVAMMTALFPGAVGTSWVAMTAANAACAEGILCRMGRAVRPKPAYADFTVPDWMSWLIVAAAAIALIGRGDLEYIGRNLAMVLALPYFLLGLAVVHTLVRRVSFSGALLVGFYVLLMISAWAALVVAGVGLIEQWTGLRQRFAGPNPGQENE
jgi:hypothetical protein